jgi:hypothetical protein
MRGVFVVPDDVDMLEFFGSEPVERAVENGYWCYEVADDRGVTLRFSFNLFEQSVQTALFVGGTKVATVAHEGAVRMTIDDQTLTCRFSYSGAEARLLLRVADSINVEWSSLRSG